MTTCRSRRVALRVVYIGLLALLVSGLQSTSFAQFDDSQNDLSPRMATYDNAEGETCFSLSLGSVNTDQQLPSDIIVFVDTSASQTGVYKKDSIQILNTFLKNLNADDRVKVFAVDLDPVELTSTFEAPNSAALRRSVDNLQQRVALGSTDMIKMLDTAANGFNNQAGRNRNVVYIGDGVSRAGLVTDKALSKATRKLVKNEIPVSSFAIGPDRNIELLAAIANHSGGNIVVDVDDPSSLDNAALNLASTVHGSVFWPTAASLPETISAIYPQVCPPIRSDRDSVVFGKLTSRNPINLTLSGRIDGQEKTVARELKPEASNIDFSFLPNLIDVASDNGGIRLPTVGSAGVREYARVLDRSADSMASLGVRALAMDDSKAAKTFAAAAMKRNPVGAGAEQLAMAARYSPQDNPFENLGGGGDSAAEPAEVLETPAPADPFGGGAPAAETPADPFGAPAAEAPEQDGDIFGSNTRSGAGDEAGSATKPMDEAGSATKPMEDGSTTKPLEMTGQEVQPPSDDISAPLQMGNPVRVDESAIDRILAEARDGGKRIIEREQSVRKIVEQKIRKQVQFEISRAVGELRSNPSEAINRLKNMIEVVDQTPELDESALTDLRYSLESALNSARQQKLGFEAQQEESAKNKAVAVSIRRAADALERDEAKYTRLIDQFESLMKERNYTSAAAVVDTAFQLAPDAPETVVATETARAEISYLQAWRNARLRDRAFLQMGTAVDISSISFLDERLITFPDAEVWLENKRKRKKFANARLTGSARDEAILDALELPTNLEYVEVPFVDVKRDLEDKYGINIALDQTAIDDALTEEELITVRYRGIRLKNALRLMLRDYNATYIVRDEVLRVISLANVSDPENLVTDVYNVGDLVAPRFNPSAAFGGNLANGGGGNAVGGGNGGGGFGNGAGGAGGGGAFCIQDGPVSTTSQVAVKKVSNSVKKPSVIELGGDLAPTEAWTDYFSRVHPSPADVRTTVRSYVENKRFDDIIGLICGALQNDRIEPWMFEALGYSMRLSGRSQAEIERVFMSAMDFATSPDDAVGVAKYMIKSGMEKRGLEILRDVSTLEPTSTEPFLLGLDAAKETDDTDALRWLTVGINSQEWPENQDLARRSQYISKALLAKLKTTDAEAAREYEADLVEAAKRDCVIEVSYTGDADVDLFVQEPGGTICSRLIPRTTAGGVHFGDNASQDKNRSGKVFEKYILPKGFSGDYQLIVKRITGEVTSGKVNVDIRQHVNSDKEIKEARPVDLKGKGAIVNFALSNGRRNDSLEEHMIKTLVDKQMVVSSQLLAQQLSQGSSSTSASEYYGGLIATNTDEPGPLQQANQNLFRGGVVGYQPEITTLQIGATLQVNHATTSDRLYVIVSLTPNFTDLLAIETFNIGAGADTAAGTNQGGVGLTP